MSNKNFHVIVPYLTPPYLGGTETVLKEVQKLGLNNKQINFVVPFVFKSKSLFDNTNNQIYPKIKFNKSIFVKLWGYIFLFKMLLGKKIKYAIVLSPRYIKYINFINVFKKNKIIIISWIHFSLNNEFHNQKKMFLKADHHLCISTGIRNQLLEIGVKSNKTDVIYNPISKKNNVKHSTINKKFVYIGRMQYGHQKNISEIIQSLKLIQEDHWSFTFIGDGIDYEKIKQEVQLSNIKGEIEFTGWVRDPWKLLDNVTALVLSSKYEGLPMVLLEAISYGIPVISSNIPTGPEDIINDDNGVLYSSGDSEELAKIMTDIIRNKRIFNSKEVKHSINNFYEAHYYTNLINSLNHIN